MLMADVFPLVEKWRIRNNTLQQNRSQLPLGLEPILVHAMGSGSAHSVPCAHQISERFPQRPHGPIWIAFGGSRSLTLVEPTASSPFRIPDAAKVT